VSEARRGSPGRAPRSEWIAPSGAPANGCGIDVLLAGRKASQEAAWIPSP